MSVAPGLNGVVNVMVVTDLVTRGGTPRRKVMPLLLLRLGALGPWPVRAVARSVIAASPCLWGVGVRVVPIESGRH
jgi:hypothetical protein